MCLGKKASKRILPHHREFEKGFANCKFIIFDGEIGKKEFGKKFGFVRNWRYKNFGVESKSDFQRSIYYFRRRVYQSLWRIWFGFHFNRYPICYVNFRVGYCCDIFKDRYYFSTKCCFICIYNRILVKLQRWKAGNVENLWKFLFLSLRSILFSMKFRWKKFHFFVINPSVSNHTSISILKM